MTQHYGTDMRPALEIRRRRQAGRRRRVSVVCCYASATVQPVADPPEQHRI